MQPRPRNALLRRWRSEIFRSALCKRATPGGIHSRRTRRCAAASSAPAICDSANVVAGFALLPRRIPRRTGCGLRPGKARLRRHSGSLAATRRAGGIKVDQSTRKKSGRRSARPGCATPMGAAWRGGGRYEETRLPVTKMRQAPPGLQCRTMQGRAIRRRAAPALLQLLPSRRRACGCAVACAYCCGRRCRFSSRLCRSVAMALSASPGLSSLRAMRRKANSRTAGFCVRASTSRYSAGISWARPSSR